MGELGTLYDLAPAALVAGSLLPHLKGHNPVEPAKLGAAILTGPYVESFEPVFTQLLREGGASLVRDAAQLAAAVAHLWREEAARQAQIRAASAVVAAGAGALDQTVAQLLALAPARSGSVHASA
jgi:3-deoxy-D-manno-octulosonic-acid transferase